jgi:hypothetical protein
MVFINYGDWETKPIRTNIKYFIGRYVTGRIEGTLPPCGTSEKEFGDEQRKSSELEGLTVGQ